MTSFFKKNNNNFVLFYAIYEENIYFGLHLQGVDCVFVGLQRRPDDVVAFGVVASSIY